MAAMRTGAAALGLVVALATAGPALGASQTVLIGESFFDPASVTINQGDSVTWTVGKGRHTVTADNGAFDSGPIGEGQTFSFTFVSPGTFTYRDRLNPSARGTVIVNPTSNAPPSASFTAAPATVASGGTIAFDASASTDSDGRIVRYQWDFDGDGVYEKDTAGTSRISLTFSNAGSAPRTIRVGLVVTDNGGAVTPAAPVTITITPAAGRTDTTPPTVDDLQVQPLTICARRGPRCRHPGGRATFLLGERSSLRVVIERVRKGRTHGRVVARLRRSARAGRVAIRLPRSVLVPGRYRLSLRATDRAGNRSLVRHATFRVKG